MSNPIAVKIYKAFEELTQACERYKECDKCDDCPMKIYCLEDSFVTLGETAYGVSLDKLDEFITGADELTSYISKEDWEAEEANVRRCDPDYM